MMTTMAAILGAVPLLIGGAEGSEMRQPGPGDCWRAAAEPVADAIQYAAVYLFFDRIGQRLPAAGLEQL